MKKLHLLSVIACVILLISSCGNSNQAGTTDGQPAKPAVVSGENVYKRTCITCHQANGEGIPNTYPPLAKSDYLADREKAIGQVIKGRTGELTVNGVKFNSTMPPQQLNDEEIAAVLSYVYSNFGNTGIAVTADEVKAVRAKL